ncbi:MAG: TetR/AcrR family transcriptional regulator [Thermodesulfobacteriota bacterium]|nr:TetR/AcrR family transcriptional regulator [Thermodesulfobacteriota bacterium]
MTNAYHHGDLKNALIRTGLEIIETEGVAALTLRRVARETRVSHAAPYRHYKNKETLLVDLAIAGFERLSETFDKSLAGFTGSAAEQIACMGKAYIRFAMDHPDLYRLMFGDRIKTKTQYAGFFRAYDSMYKMLLEMVQNAGPRAAGDAAITVITMWATVHGYVTFILDNSPDPYVGSPGQIDRLMDKVASFL